MKTLNHKLKPGPVVSAFIGFLYILSAALVSQAENPEQLTLDSTWSLARQNYPLIRQMDIIRKTESYSLDNASKAYWPQFNINGQYTYQSDVIDLPFQIPGGTIPEISKDQYKVVAELSQGLTDGFNIRNQKEFIRSSSLASQYSLETEFVKLKERIEQIYFGILLLDHQLEQNVLVKKDIQSGIDKTQAALQNGTSTQSNLDNLKAELLKLSQKETELRSARQAYTGILSLMINRKLGTQTIFINPPDRSISSEIKRPELKYFDEQRNGLEIQSKLVSSKNIPRLALFVQAGYGKPGLNLLKSEPDMFYIGGLRLNWSISGLYTFKKEKKIISLNQNAIDVQKDLFLLNTNTAMEQQENEIDKLIELLKSDDEIVTLRNRIKETAKVQLENGIITSNDYIIFVSAADQAQQSRLLHHVQLDMAKYHYNTLTGN